MNHTFRTLRLHHSLLCIFLSRTSSVSSVFCLSSRCPLSLSCCCFEVVDHFPCDEFGGLQPPVIPVQSPNTLSRWRNLSPPPWEHQLSGVYSGGKQSSRRPGRGHHEPRDFGGVGGSGLLGSWRHGTSWPSDSRRVDQHSGTWRCVYWSSCGSYHRPRSGQFQQRQCHWSGWRPRRAWWRHRRPWRRPRPWHWRGRPWWGAASSRKRHPHTSCPYCNHWMGTCGRSRYDVYRHPRGLLSQIRLVGTFTFILVSNKLDWPLHGQCLTLVRHLGASVQPTLSFSYSRSDRPSNGHVSLGIHL